MTYGKDAICADMPEAICNKMQKAYKNRSCIDRPYCPMVMKIYKAVRAILKKGC